MSGQKRSATLLGAGSLSISFTKVSSCFIFQGPDMEILHKYMSQVDKITRTPDTMYESLTISITSVKYAMFTILVRRQTEIYSTLILIHFLTCVFGHLGAPQQATRRW